MRSRRRVLVEPPYSQSIRKTSHDDWTEDEQAPRGESERSETDGLYGCSDTVEPRAEIREECVITARSQVNYPTLLPRRYAPRSLRVGL
jgi:hypothetical protein